MEVMPTLDKVDAILTDPPYGINADKGKTGDSKSFKGGKPVQMRFYPENTWDSVRPDIETFNIMLDISDRCIIWGGNYFSDYLPVMGRWLWWDKCQTMPTFGDGELAWTNLNANTPKKFVLGNNKLLAQRREKFHPTQKPVELMEWCLGFLPDADTILDPFLGSGTTLVACAKLGRRGIGIEMEPKYFDIAVDRVKRAYDQPDLFVQAPVARPEQEQLWGT